MMREQDAKTETGEWIHDVVFVTLMHLGALVVAIV